MRGAVVAFYAQLQPIYEGDIVRSSGAMWPLDQAQPAFEALSDYANQQQSKQGADWVEQSLSYMIIPS